MKRQIALGVGLALTLLLGGCGGNETTKDTEQTPQASVAASPTVTPQTSPSASASASSSPSASVSAAGPSTSSDELQDTSLTELPVDLKLPIDVGNFHGEGRTVSGLGEGSSNQIEYRDENSGREMTLLRSALEDSDLKESQPLGQLGVCGYLYGNKETPMCLMKVEGGQKIVVNGDYQASLDETRAFTIQLINAAMQTSAGA